ncbi:MAG TPA: DUF6358 family protein [Sphingobacteriaceae bacterium]
MAKKILLNIFLNIAIITIVLCLFWLFNNKHYPLAIGALFVLAIFIYFKVMLVKSVRSSFKNSQKTPAGKKGSK